MFGVAIPPRTLIIYHPGASAPDGYLKCNGALVSRTAYAYLFAIIGTTFGAGDGSTTFALPDMRGEFLRGLDDGRGVDAGRVLGSWQADDFLSHTHPVGSHPGYYVGADQSLGGQSYSVAGGRRTEAAGGAETRPRNVAGLFCIAWKP